MPTIVFEPLSSTSASPDTTGGGQAGFRPLRSFGLEASGNYGFGEMPVLRSSGEGTTQDTWVGNGVGVLPRLSGLGFQDPGDYGVASLPGLRSYGTNYLSNLVPSAGAGLGTLPAMTSLAAGVQNSFGDAAADLPRMFGIGLEEAGAYGIAEMPRMRSAGVETFVAPTTYIIGAVRPIMSIFASSTWIVSDQLVMTDSFDIQVLLSVLSGLRLTDRLSYLATLQMALSDSFVARDYFIVVFEATIADDLAFADLASTTLQLIMALADEMVLADSQLNWLSAITTIVSAMVLSDRLRFIAEMGVVDELVLTDLIFAQQSLVARIISELILADEVTGQMTMLVFLKDSFALSDELTGTMDLLMELLDNFNLRVRFNTPEGVQYTGYSMNTLNAAMSENTNFNFNSFASPGGLTLAAGKEGIYLLGGDTDQGNPIPASVRLGLTDFGTSVLKHVPNAYVGYTADGRLVMKVTTTDGGKKKENWYGLAPRVADSPIEGRFDVVKGLVARYWGFEVVNVDGADFELDSLKVWPMQVQRRKSGR